MDSHGQQKNFLWIILLIATFHCQKLTYIHQLRISFNHLFIDCETGGTILSSFLLLVEYSFNFPSPLWPVMEDCHLDPSSKKGQVH